MRILLLILTAILFICCNAYAQKPTPTAKSSPSATPINFNDIPLEERERIIRESVGAMAPAMQASTQREETTKPIEQRTTYETNLGWGVLGFGCIIIGLEIGVMLRLQRGWGPQNIRMIGITLVIISGLFLIVTGYSQEQIAPMIGLLGTITGFLLGKTSSKDDD